jgi:hypothetical protein
LDGGKRRPWGFARHRSEAPAGPVAHEGCVSPRRDSAPGPARVVSPRARGPGTANASRYLGVSRLTIWSATLRRSGPTMSGVSASGYSAFPGRATKAAAQPARMAPSTSHACAADEPQLRRRDLELRRHEMVHLRGWLELADRVNGEAPFEVLADPGVLQITHYDPRTSCGSHPAPSERWSHKHARGSSGEHVSSIIRRVHRVMVGPLEARLRVGSMWNDCQTLI